MYAHNNYVATARQGCSCQKNNQSGQPYLWEQNPAGGLGACKPPQQGPQWPDFYVIS